GSMPYAAKYGASRRRHTRSLSASGTGIVWQKKLTLYGLLLSARNRCSSERSDSAESNAAGSEPSAPALDTAIASGAPCTPAIGAWIMGSSVPKRSLSIDGVSTLVRYAVG